MFYALGANFESDECPCCSELLTCFLGPFSRQPKVSARHVVSTRSDFANCPITIGLRLRLSNACTWCSFDLILHLKALSFDTGCFYVLYKALFFQVTSLSRALRATLFRDAASPSRHPHVLRSRAAFRRPERRRGGGSGQRASERASPRFAEAGAGDLSHRRLTQ